VALQTTLAAWYWKCPLQRRLCVAWQWRTDRKLKIWSTTSSADDTYAPAEFTLDDLIKPDGFLRQSKTCIDRLHDHQKIGGLRISRGVTISCSRHTPNSPKAAQMRELVNLAPIFCCLAMCLPEPESPRRQPSQVAAMHALNEAAGIHPSDLTLAAWCQRVENSVVGAPCGIMDQLHVRSEE